MMKLDIKQARLALGMTQPALAARIGVHWTTVASWEQGRAKASQPACLFIETLLKDAEFIVDEFHVEALEETQAAE